MKTAIHTPFKDNGRGTYETARGNRHELMKYEAEKPGYGRG